MYVGNANEDGGSYYVKLDGSNEVHLMTASNVETFTGKKASDFWNMYIGMENVSDLTSLDITYNGGTKTYVRHMEEKKDDDSDSKHRKSVTSAAMKRLINQRLPRSILRSLA